MEEFDSRYPAAPEAPPARPTLTRRVRIDRAGRVVVLAGIRKALDIHDGQDLTISLDDGFIRLQTIDAALERVWAIAKRRRRRRGSASVVDEFIAERRAEAAKD